MQQTHTTISEGIKYYNEGLAEREARYTQSHDAATQSLLQTSRNLIDTRTKHSAISNEKINRAIIKLREAIVENGNNLDKVSCELDKVSLHLERYLDERQKQKAEEESFQHEIDPEDLI